MNKITAQRDMEPVLLLGFKDKSRLLNHIRESRIAVRTTRTERMYLRGSLSVVSCPPQSGSLVHDLDLLVEHLAREAIDRHACHAEALAKAGAPSNAVPPSTMKFLRSVSSSRAVCFELAHRENREDRP